MRIRGQHAQFTGCFSAAGDPMPKEHVSDGVLGDEKLHVSWWGGCLSDSQASLSSIQLC